MQSSGLNSIADDQKVQVTVDSVHGAADDRRLDAWELKASRRALLNLRELLHGEPVLKLMSGQINEADDRLKGYLAASNGKYTATQVVLRVTGLKSDKLFAFLRSGMAATAGGPEQKRQTAIDIIYPMHPEHYGIPDYLGVVETMGGIPTRSRVKPTNEVPAFVSELIDPTYPVKLTGLAEIDDGTVFTYVLQQFKDTEDGMEANLRIWYPEACPPIYLEEHAEHYAVEFRNGCRMAAAAQ